MFFLASINPESYFWGTKLGGLNAAAYLLLGGFIGLIFSFLVFRRKREGEILSICYFGYYLVEASVTYLVVFDRGFTVPPLPVMGFLVSLILSCIRRKNGKSSKRQRGKMILNG
jgi:hypothetical protein